jgi:hypothetical protein
MARPPSSLAAHACWNYFTTQFLFTYPVVAAPEIEPWPPQMRSQTASGPIQFINMRTSATGPPVVEGSVSRRGSLAVHGSVESRDKSGSTGFQAALRVCAKQSVAGPICHRTDTGHDARAQGRPDLTSAGRTVFAAADVARVVTTVLRAPQDHLGAVYELTGPAALDIDELAEQYAKALDRPITALPLPYDEWIEHLTQAGLDPHTQQHVATMARLHRDDRYNRLTHDVEDLTGRPAESVQEYIRQRRELFT